MNPEFAKQTSKFQRRPPFQLSSDLKLINFVLIGFRLCYEEKLIYFNHCNYRGKARVGYFNIVECFFGFKIFTYVI